MRHFCDLAFGDPRALDHRELHQLDRIAQQHGAYFPVALLVRPLDLLGDRQLLDLLLERQPLLLSFSVQFLVVGRRLSRFGRIVGCAHPLQGLFRLRFFQRPARGVGLIGGGAEHALARGLECGHVRKHESGADAEVGDVVEGRLARRRVRDEGADDPVVPQDAQLVLRDDLDQLVLRRRRNPRHRLVRSGRVEDEHLEVGRFVRERGDVVVEHARVGGLVPQGHGQDAVRQTGGILRRRFAHPRIHVEGQHEQRGRHVLGGHRHQALGAHHAQWHGRLRIDVLLEVRGQHVERQRTRGLRGGDGFAHGSPPSRLAAAATPAGWFRLRPCPRTRASDRTAARTSSRSACRAIC